MPARGGRAVVRELIDRRVEQARTRLGASYGISTAYSWSDAGDAVMIDGFVDPDRAGEVLPRMLSDLDELRRAGPELATDFVRARRAALAGSLAGPTSSSSVADEIQSAVVHRVPIALAGALPGAIAETTLADARAAVAADLQPSRMVVVLSGRPTDTAAAFTAAGASRVQIVSSERTPAR